MCYVAVPEGAEAVLAAKFAVMRSLLGERQWRVYLGSEARARGHGGIAAVARAAGCSESTVAAGVAEIEAGGGGGGAGGGGGRRGGRGVWRGGDRGGRRGGGGGRGRGGGGGRGAGRGGRPPPPPPARPASI